MKKVILILFIIIFLSGCMKVSEFKSIDVDNVLNRLLKEKTSLVNNSSKGYKYYLPLGVELINSNDYNEELYSHGDYYYLYIDLVNYYYNEDIEYSTKDNLFYSKPINYNNISGYLEIEELTDSYKIEFLYNHSKIESFVRKENLKRAIINMCYILNSIKFNKNLSSLEIGDINEQFNEEVFGFYTPKKIGNFVEYIEEYGNYEEPTDGSGNIGNEEYNQSE